MYFFYNLLRSIGMGITEEYLTKIFFIYQINDMGHPVFVQFVKNIIQK